MTFRSFIGLVFVALLWSAAGQGQTPSSPDALSCPESLAVAETVRPVRGWEATGGEVERPFERVSIYNGRPGGKEYELAPDDEKKSNGKIVQAWNLKDYRSMNIFMRCRYHDTPAVLSVDLPSKLSACTFTFQLIGKGQFVGKSILVCR